MNPPASLFHRFKIIPVFLLLVFSHVLHGQGIKGTVVGADGDPLPFASIGVKGSDQGTAANVEGQVPTDPDAW
jgi:hypothetical protein